jgi:hypothetical protein
MGGMVAWGDCQSVGSESCSINVEALTGEEPLLRVVMTRVMGHVALGLCDGERPVALGLDAALLPAGSTMMVCPIGCAVSSTGQGVLVGIYGAVQLQAVAAEAPPAGTTAPASRAQKAPVPASGPEEQRARRQREQLMVLARRLAGVMQ